MQGWQNDLPTYMSSRGEMKMSLKLMTCCWFSKMTPHPKRGANPYVLVAQMLEEL
jgi:hypothetical protein